MIRPVRRGGQLLWQDHADAVRYALARHQMYRTRQQVRQVVVDGVPLWRVSRSCRVLPAGVGEPCS